VYKEFLGCWMLHVMCATLKGRLGIQKDLFI